MHNNNNYYYYAIYFTLGKLTDPVEVEVEVLHEARREPGKLGPAREAAEAEAVLAIVIVVLAHVVAVGLAHRLLLLLRGLLVVQGRVGHVARKRWGAVFRLGLE